MSVYRPAKTSESNSHETGWLVAKLTLFPLYMEKSVSLAAWLVANLTRRVSLATSQVVTWGFGSLVFVGELKKHAVKYVRVPDLHSVKCPCAPNFVWTDIFGCTRIIRVHTDHRDIFTK